ncbi:type II toxin-antitoxin system RelE/ParE family toxin [Methanoculleus sp. Wushi-C6]|uniref:Type II toxin-antitoxin system RelE/ParE family toxin n=1 Tax=Methanoculleus caldifontis TaxID=2651577 RepID=A0ABU3X3A0_9EURY|nr:type II toxin-antitoxin system RelE/ParE family toxin [Methanoculleus sp. Wushi-C6]MDV2482516.1 type II toxin-antitoxin system RelE/ParE family toxin [Methanoculleus sp. Wushi-C6]
MPYTVIWTEKALKNLKQLPRETAARIIAAVERTRDDPQDHLQQLQGSPFFKLRVGKYRVIVDLRRKTMIIYVIKVGKRGNVYNNA